MELLDLSLVKEGDYVNIINANKSLFFGVIKKEYKGCLAVAVDIKQSNVRDIHENEIVEFALAFKHQAIRCGAKVVASTLNGGVQLLLLSAPRVLNIIERRQFRRLQTIIDIDYCLLPMATKYDFMSKIEPIWFKKLKRSFTVDISAGGICLITYENNIVEKQAIISFSLKEKPITALCNIIRVDPSPDNKNQKTAMQYIDMHKEHIQLIDSYVIEKSKEA